ncbi:partial Cysteine desulfurase NifS, partial [Anaerolineae bacterium]
MMRVTYLDNNATTKVDPGVLEAMLPYFSEYYGNPSSMHAFGGGVAAKIQHAREQVARLIGALPDEVIFTSCGTESNNSAIHSALVTQPGKRHVVTTAVEHSANINFGEYLKKQGYDVTFLPVESDGSLDLHLLEKSIRPDTAIVSA